MPYSVTLTDGTTIATINDGTVNTTTTSLTLIGKNYAGYGIFLNENFVELLENFSNSTPPTAPLTGQLWYDSRNEILKVYNGASNLWKPISSSISQSSAPSAQSSVTGDLWWNTTTAQLNVWSGSAWIIIGPAYTSTAGTSGAVVQTILDTGSQSHVVVIFYISNAAIAILSKDATFTPQTAISGFPTIVPGFNLINASTLTGAQFTGTVQSTAITSLAGIPASDYMTNQTGFTTSYALTVGSGSQIGGDLQFVTAGGTTYINELVNNKSVTFNVTSNSVQQPMLTLGATTQMVTVSNLTVAGSGTQGLFVGAGGMQVANVILPTGTVNIGSNTNKFANVYATYLVGTAVTSTGNLTASSYTLFTKDALPTVNNTVNLGSSAFKYANVYATYLVGTAVTAQYADLAERFESDTVYPAGTVVALGGTKEITAAADDLSEDVFGVISTKAAFLMNGDAGNDQTHPPIAVNGRVPVRVIGKISKGDRLVSAGSGLARAASRTEITAFNVIGRSLQNKTTDGEGTVEAIVKLNS